MSLSKSKKPYIITEESVDKAARGSIEIYQGSMPIPKKLNSKQWAEFKAAKERGYLLSNKRGPLSSIWWDWCEAVQQPVIVVQKKRKYADITIDLIVLGVLVIPKGTIDKIALEICERYAVKQSRWYIGDTYSNIEKIPIEEVEPLAEELVAVLRETELVNKYSQFKGT